MNDDGIGLTPPTPPTPPVAKRLIALDRLPTDRPTYVEAGGRELAVVRRNDDVVYVFANACPHAGGNLGGGDLDGDTIVCPWHQWAFDLETGRCTHAPLARVQRFAAEVRDGVVYFFAPA